MAKAAELVRRKGIKGFLLDPYNYIEYQIEKGESETQYINKLLTKITQFCYKYGVHLFLVAHPTKMPKINGKRDIPDLDSISGSVHFRNKAFNGISVYRDRTENKVEIHILKVKWFWLGKTGIVEFIYDMAKRQYIPIIPNESEPQPNEQKQLEPPAHRLKPPEGYQQKQLQHWQDTD